MYVKMAIFTFTSSLATKSSIARDARDAARDARDAVVYPPGVESLRDGIKFAVEALFGNEPFIAFKICSKFGK